MPMLWLVIGGVVLIWTAVGLTLWFMHLRFWRWRLATKPVYESEETLRLPDGGLIELRRIGAPTTAGPQGERSEVPVLMLHGLAMNHRNQDVHEEYSFARHLYKQGRDVWLLTSRSGRRSSRLFGPVHSDFASMVKHDLPGAVAAVLARTRQRQLDVAAFSMGGTLLLAGLERTLDSRLVRRAAMFGTPGKVRKLRLLGLFAFLGPKLTPAVWMRAFTSTFAPAPRLVPSLLWRRLYNPDNIDRRMESSMLHDTWEAIPGALGSDFLNWSTNKHGGEVTVDGVPVLSGLSKVSIPAVFFAGSVDWLAPPYTVRAGFDAWGRELPDVEKRFVLLGREHGTRNDYGHCDICFGVNAREEVFAPAARFLNEGVLPAPQTQPATDAVPSFGGANAQPAE